MIWLTILVPVLLALGLVTLVFAFFGRRSPV